ncbi:hypothetical protein KR009_004750 [Drosophila setifemur]|nr:hypothetical protein KR009_004750 [Drosophila setifemur]
MDPISAVLLYVASFFGLVYIFLTWNFGYWRKRGIQTAKSWPFFGSFPSNFTQKRNMVYDIDDIYQQYKGSENIVGVFNTRIPQLLVMTPEYSHKIYTTDFRHFRDNERRKFINKRVDKILGNNPFALTGALWKERRIELLPGLTPNRVKGMYPICQSAGSKFVDYIKRKNTNVTSEGLNAKDLCLCYTSEVVSDVVMGFSANAFTDNPKPLMGLIKRVFSGSFAFIFYSMAANLWPTLSKFYSVALFTKDVEVCVDDQMKKSIDLRRQDPTQQRDDFLNYVMQLQDKMGLDTIEITSHTVPPFLTDGFETSALVLAHCLLTLARNPEVLKKVRQEIGPDPLTFEQLSEMPLLEACVHETLRLFPPLLTARKLVSESYEFKNKDGVCVSVHPGDVVMIPVLSFHHDPQYFEDPESFKPERFLEENGGVRKYRDQGLYYGFGFGPRLCPGMRFSLTMTKVAMVEIVQNFDISVNPKTRTDNRVDDTFFMATLKGGIYLDFKERK